MADRIEIGWLFDFYGPLLTERQQKLLALYCNEDFSLSEIGMSAQSYVYEGYKTETGVHLEHFIRSEYWDNTVSGNVSRHYRKSPRCERV